MSIGSNTDGGASAILVRDLAIERSDNGLRIKSNPTRGGLVRDVVYEDICIRGTANPVVMETDYAARVEGGSQVMLEGLDADHRLGIRFDNVVFDSAIRFRCGNRGGTRQQQAV